VYGWPLPEHAWRFRVATNEPAISHGENAGHSRHVWVSDWNAVLALLDEWPWAVFYPLYVNPTFREASSVTRTRVRASTFRWRLGTAASANFRFEHSDAP
jgi:hypothetical protein